MFENIRVIIMSKFTAVCCGLCFYLIPLIFSSCQVSQADSNTTNSATVNSAKVDTTFSVFLKHYDRFFETNFKVSECPGAAVVIVKDTTVVYQKGFGVKQIHTKDSVDLHTVFRWASLSKGISSILAANVVDQGLLEWNQKLVAILPSFLLKNKKQTNRLTIKHLLSHTTGLYPYTFSKQIQRGMPLDRLITLLKNTPVVAKEGTTYAYQNAVFSVIEKILKKQTQQSFADLITQRIFEPAGMTDASTNYEAISQNPNVALPHVWNTHTKKYYLRKIHKRYYNVAAAGGVNGSISDMGDYLKILLGLRPSIISARSLQQVFTQEICTSHQYNYVNLWEGVTDSYYALGFRVMDYHGRTILYHGGNVNNYKSQLMVDPNNRIAIGVLFNAPNSYNGAVIPTFLNYFDFYKHMAKNNTN